MKNSKRILTMLLVACICESAMNIPVYADGVNEESGNTYDVKIVIDGEGSADVETRPGQLESVGTATSTETTQNPDGSTTTKTESSASGYVTGSGMIVDYTGSSNKTETPAENEESITTGTSNEHYTAVNSDKTYGSEGGSEYATGEKVPEVTVNVPLTDKDDPETEEKENVSSAEGSSEKKTEGDVKESEEDGEYDYTETESVKPGKVTVTTDSITVTENATSGTDMDYVSSDTTPQGDVVDENGNIIKGNDILIEADSAKDSEGNRIESDTKSVDADNYSIKEGFGYVYIGSANISEYAPALAYTAPNQDKYLAESGKFIIKDENGNVLEAEEPITIVTEDGTEYVIYLHRPHFSVGNEVRIEDIYIDGEWYSLVDSNPNDDVDDREATWTDDNADKKDHPKLNPSHKVYYKKVVKEDPNRGVLARWSSVQQFMLVDAETDEVITAYCADATTPTQSEFSYNMTNVEDADYYTDEQAAMIRSVADNGYWGTKDDPETAEAEYGSLEAMKAKLRATGEFTEEELAAITDGMAMTATQMAIWTFSNYMEGLDYIGIQHITGDENNTVDFKGAGQFDAILSEEEKDAGVLIYKMYEYLIHLDPTYALDENEEQTTANTIINEKNFIDDLAVTVIGKDEAHENNQDDDKTNDAYVTEITFSLVVKPAENNEDDLIVRVYGYDAEGQPYEVASAYIASSDENQEVLKSDNGNYTLSGITIVEGNSTFNIALEGVQKLESGVYLYSSEVRVDEDNNATSSQTLVGVAQGDRAVNVSMSINFDLNVEDEIVATEHIWREEWVDVPEEPTTPPEEPTTPPEEPTTPPEEPTTPPEDPADPPVDPADPPVDPVDPQTDLEEDPLIIIEDEEIPLTDIPDEPIPQTGDSFFWYICSAFAALGLAAVSFFDKKRKNDENA